MSQIESITQEFGTGISLISHNQFIKQLNRLANKLAETHSNNNTVQCQITHEQVTFDIQKIFASLKDSSITQISIASNYIAILTSSNLIYRVKFRVLPLAEKKSFQGLQAKEPSEGGCSAGSAMSSSDHKQEDYKRLFEMNALARRGANFTAALGAESIPLVESQENTLIRASSVGFGRGAIRGLRPIRALAAMRPVSLPRNTNIRRSYLVANARTNLPPATEVPEELIEQAQAVLQGKSRSVITRELQRTGLDVNQAVNNLLSKDDDGDDEEASPAVLTSDDILYLLESSGGNIHSVRREDLQSELDAELENFPIEASLDSVRRLTREPRSDLEYAFNLRTASEPLEVPPITYAQATATNTLSATPREGRESRLENLSPGGSTTATNLEGVETNSDSFAASINNNFDRWPFSYSPTIHPSLGIPENMETQIPIQEGTTLTSLITLNTASNQVKQSDEAQTKKDKETDQEKEKETISGVNLFPQPIPFSFSSCIEFYSDVECWTESETIENGYKVIKDGPQMFSKIAATDSELIAVTQSDYLAYWPWDLSYGFACTNQHMYPLCSELDIKQSDRIKFLTSTRFRVAIATHTNAVASWPDRSLRNKIGNSSLDTRMHQLRLFPYNQVISSLVTSDIYSACLTSSAHVYWWGCMPLSDCKKAIQKVKSKFDLYHQSRDQAGGKRNQQDKIKENSQVYLNESPYYTIGTKGLCIRQEAKVALLQENVYSPVTNEKCRFKLAPQSEYPIGDLLEPVNIKLADPPITLDGNNRSTSKKKHKSSTSDHSYGAQSANLSWSLKEVIFLDEPLMHSSQGEVLKVDGNFAVIHFKTHPTTDATTSTSSKRSTNDILSSCRIMKKDELILHRPGAFHKGPICIHLNPKRLTIDVDCTPLALCADNRNLYIVYNQSNTVKLSPTSLESARFESTQTFSKSMSNHLLQNQPLILHINSLTTIPSFFMQDSKGSFLPLLKTESNSFKDIPFIPLPPLTALQTYSHIGQKFLFIVMAFKRQYLTPHLIKSSPENVLKALDEMSYDQVLLHTIPSEITNAKCNIIHTTIGTCSLQSCLESTHSDANKTITFFSGGNRQCVNNRLKKYRVRECTVYDSDQLVPPTLTIPPAKLYVPRVIDQNCSASPASSISAAEPSDSEQDQIQDTPTPVMTLPHTPTGTLKSATLTSTHTSAKSQIIPDDLKCLKILLDSPVLAPHMPSLLSQKNIHGLTPFMQAIHSRTYKAALYILNHILKLLRPTPPNFTEEDFLNSMIFPSGSFADDNPLFMLCANDLCSITWTGETHETQIDIYECRTCGLTGDYCCCSECARVCHKGHDCTRKHPSANAFCDCKNKIICRAQNLGDQPSRIQLLNKLVTETKLTTLTNSSGEYILTFLATTHFRQNKEQDYRKPGSRSSCKPGTPYQEPVRFAKQALEICLDNWTTLEAVLNGQSSSYIRFGPISVDINSAYVHTDQRSCEPNAYLDNQKGSMHIDAFIYTLFCKNSKDLIERLLTTVCTAYTNGEKLAEIVIKRFCRSVIRILLVSTYELWASASSSGNQLNAKKKCQNVIDLAQYVFKALHYFSMKEIWMIAQALVTPIQLGVVKPCTPFQLNTENKKRNLAEEFFRLRPHESLPTPSSKVKQPSATAESALNTQEDQKHDSLRSEEIQDYAASDTETHSQDSDFIIEETASTATHGANSEATRATFGSSHIVAYFSGDSSTESEDPNVDDPLYSGMEQDDNSVHGSDIASPSNIEASPRLLMTPPPPIIDVIASPQHPLSDLVAINTDRSETRTGMIDIISHSPREPIHPDSPVYMPIDPQNNANTQTEYNSGTYQPSDDSLFRMVTDMNEQPASTNTQWNPPLFDSVFNRNVLDLNQTKKLQSTQPQASTSQPSYSNQVLILAKAFHFLVEQIVDLILHLNTLTYAPLLQWKASDIIQSFMSIWVQMEPLLVWLIQVMDTNEAQLRFGSSFATQRNFLTTSSDPVKSVLAGAYSSQRLTAGTSFDFRSGVNRSDRMESHPISSTAPPKTSQDTESISYLLSLARSAACEHKEFLPSLDLASLEYVAYILDAVLYLLKNQPDENSIIEPYPINKIKLFCKFPSTPSESTLYTEAMDISLAPETIKQPNTKPSFSIRVPFKQVQTPELLAQRLNQEVIRLAKHTAKYYKRSPCLGFFGCPDPHYLAPLDTFPLAEMPHLLQPNIRREVLFSAPQDPIIPDPHDKSPFHTMNSLTALLSLPLVKCSSQLKRLASHQFEHNTSLANMEFQHQPPKQLDLKRGCDVFMGRWRLTIEFFCKLISGVKIDSLKVLYLMEDFHSKEAKFRHEMEKLRMELSKEQRDLIIDVARERVSLIRDTFQQLYTFAESRKGLLTPLCVMQVKVSFKNEQGEGNGVARSFYTSFAEEILNEEKLPPLDGILTQCDNPKYRYSKRDLKDSTSREEGSTGWDDRMVPLNIMVPPFHPHSSSRSMTRQKVLFGARLYPNVARIIGLLHAGKVTGMLLELPSTQLTHLLNNTNLLDRYVQHAREQILAQGQPNSPPPSYDDLDPSIQPSDLEQWSSSSTKPTTIQHPQPSTTDLPKPKRAKSELSELAPLFFEPGKCGFYSPRPGRYTVQRSQAYICVGRIIGLCLLTNEVFPLPLNRHVLKYLLGKHSSICWHDYAFMDLISFESLRKLLLLAEENKPEEILATDLTFQATFSSLECLEPIDLVENGSSIPLTIDNLEYYVKLYTEYRMTKLVRNALLDIQLGLSEVIPNTYFSNLTPEDLRLLLNGCNSVNIENLKKIVVINNESRQENDIVNQFIKWFWSIVNAFTDKEKQDLLYFWTSCPNIPASMQSYQPEPSIHIRPPDEDHLPTANTCIARLYIPLYSCRSQLKTKLGLAIKTKHFGFV